MNDMKELPAIRVLWEVWADRGLPLPSYETAGAAGADIRANLKPEDRATGLTLDPMHLCASSLPLEFVLRFQPVTRCKSGLAPGLRSSLASWFPIRPARLTAIIADRWAWRWSTSARSRIPFITATG